jgi:hypothetical protein
MKLADSYSHPKELSQIPKYRDELNPVSAVIDKLPLQ